MNRYDITDPVSYCLGMSLSIEALKQRPEKVRNVVLSVKASRNEQLDYLLSLCEKNEITPVYDDKIISRLSLKENCYCIAFFDKFYDQLNADQHVLLYRFSDLGELGTTIRSAVSFDFRDIALIDSDIDYFDPACVRASMGAMFHCHIVRYDSLDDYLKDHPGCSIYPFVSSGERELSTLTIKKPFALLISEDYHALDGMDGFYIEHENCDEISLSIRSSIILQRVFDIKS